MPDWSRRRALQAVAATGAFALAGCSGESSRSRSVPRERGESVPPSDLDVLFVRDTDGEPVFDVDRGSDSIAEEDTETPPAAERRPRRAYLTDDDGRERITFGSTPAAEDLRTFVDGADLGSESVYLTERLVGECYEARLVGIYREDDGIDGDFCQALRPADVECSADGRDTVGVAVRLAFPGDELSGLGWSWSGDCEHLSTIASEGGDGR